MTIWLERQISAPTMVEWRVFIPTSGCLSALSTTPLGTIFTRPVVLESLEEKRSDIYTVINEHIGLKRRGKKEKLELKLRTRLLSPSETKGLEGMEEWKKIKLGGKKREKLGITIEADLERIMREYNMYDSALMEALQGHKGTSGDGQNVEVVKTRLKGKFNREEEESLAKRLLKGLGMHTESEGGLYLEDCLVEIKGKGQWRSYAVEGTMEEVQEFLTATELGRAIYELRKQPGAILTGYAGWLARLASPSAFGGEGGGGILGETSCLNDIYPIPPLPDNPYRGQKEACTIKRISLVVVQHPTTGKYLAVEETKNRGWWLPAGHVDPGETYEEGAYRETLEEAGVGITLEGILRFEHKLTTAKAGRIRVVFFARPIHPDAPLKSQPDEESLSARWVSLEELEALPRRGDELLKWIKYIEAGGAIYPLSILAAESDLIHSTANEVSSSVGGKEGGKKGGGVRKD